MSKRPQSLADMLPWGNLYDSGLVFTKDGQLLAGYYASPPDHESSTMEDSLLLSDTVAGALKMLGSGWATWGDVVSCQAGHYPAPEESHFPDPFSRAVDDSRRERFETAGQHFENDRVLLISYQPPREQVSKLTDMMFTTNTGKKTSTRQRIVDNFNKQLNDFENKTAGMIGLRRMVSFPVIDALGNEGTQDELVNYLNYCATGSVQGIMLPRSGAWMDQLIAGQDAWPGENPVIGRDYIAVVAIEGRPDESFPNILCALNTLEMPYRFSQRMIWLDPEPAASEINRYRNNWTQQIRGLASKIVPGGNGGPINDFAAQMAFEANTAWSWAKKGDVKFGFYSPIVILRHPDPHTLREWADKVEKTIIACGFGARVEETNTMPAWRGGLPGEVRQNVRRPLTHSMSYADFLPLSGVWTGDTTAPCPLYPENSPSLLWAVTDGGIPFRANLHPGPRSDLGHTLIFGPSGAGKTTLTNLLALQARRYPRMSITAFDMKHGMMGTALACGGAHHDLGRDVNVDGMYAPLANLDDPTDIEWAANYTSTLYELQQHVAPDAEIRGAIFNSLRDLSQSPRRLRSMTTFVNTMQHKDAREVFRFYTMKGSAGRMLDGSEDRVSTNPFSVYECLELMGMGDEYAVPVLLHLFRRFARSLDGRPSLLFLAEAWSVFRHPIWSKWLGEMLRLLRGKNCAVIMDTQSLADAVNSPLLALLSENCDRKIFLPNSKAAQATNRSDSPGVYELYKILGMNDRQVDIIRRAIPKQEYYFTGPDGCRLINLGLGPLELAVAGATSEEDVLEIRQVHARWGDDWLPHFLAGKGIQYHPRRIAETAYA